MNTRIRTGTIGRTIRMVAAGTLVFQLGLLPSCRGLLTVFNPCGTIFGFCEQEDLDFILSENIPNYDLDPTCTIPFATGPGCAGGPIWPTPGPRP